MKTILIATDFSDASVSALNYGIELASLMKLRVVIFHAFQTAITVPEAYAPITSEELKSTAEKEMRRLAEETQKLQQLQFEVVATEGTMPDSLLLYASKYEDCMIVCGMKGAGKSRFRLFGSTAVELARKSTIPILIVPENCKLSSLNKLAFATDFNFETDVQTLSPLKEIGEKFQAKVIIVRITTKKYAAIEEIHYRSERLNIYLKQLDPQYEFIRANDVTDGLLNFIDRKDIDMITLIPKHHDFFDRLFGSSETKQMIYHSTIPMLLLPEQKISMKSELQAKKEHVV